MALQHDHTLLGEKQRGELYAPVWSQDEQSAQHTFQNLLEAAASQYGQNQDSINAQNASRPSYGGPTRASRRKRKDAPVDQIASSSKSPAAKRQRVSRNGYDHFGGINGQDDGHAHQASVLSAAEASQVNSDISNSVTVLFKPPSEASKKYTRPPMAKIFGTMDLTPEEFLDIQAAAKDYMLDGSHHERNEAVGAKSRGDADLTKLKLFTCVKAFLQDEGWGERCWGNGSTNVESKSLRWPKMKNQIITALTPLMRRMVTNERQRRYARRSRQAKRDSPHADSMTESNDHSTVTDLDPTLQGASLTDKSSTQANELNPSFHEVSLLGGDPVHPSQGPLSYLVNVVDHGGKIISRLEMEESNAAHLEDLLQGIMNMVPQCHLGSLSALTPAGLIRIVSEGDWTRAHEEVRRHEWMDGQLRIVVEAIGVQGL